jgi:hypothetical protein
MSRSASRSKRDWRLREPRKQLKKRKKEKELRRKRRNNKFSIPLPTLKTDQR